MEKVIIGKVYTPKSVKVKKFVNENIKDTIIGTSGEFRRRDSLLAYIDKNKSYLTKKNLLDKDEKGNTTLILECGRGKNLTKILFIIEKEEDEETNKKVYTREDIV